VPGIAPLTGQPNLLASGVPEIPPELRRRVLQYLETRAANLMDVSPDGKQVLISTRFGETNQLHVVEQPLGARYQLTFTPEPIGTARFHPTDPRFLFFLQDVGGGEFYQVYRLDRRTGRSELLTDGKSRHEAEASPHFRKCPKSLRISAAPLIYKPLKSLGFLEMRGWFRPRGARGVR
jgi:hypothetical protein